MSTQEQRIEVFHDTMNWINSDADLTAAVVYGKKHTKVYYEDDYPEFALDKKEDTEITVTTDRSYQATMRLSKENSGAKIAVMNFLICPSQISMMHCMISTMPSTQMPEAP